MISRKDRPDLLRAGAPGAAAQAPRPLVSFVLFAFNQEPLVRAAVEGALAQSYQPLEVILSDDCSADRTFEIMRDSAAAYRGPHAVRVRRNERNLGLAAHINAVLAEARGDIICWAAGDDISLPERTDILVRPLLEDASVVATHSSVTEIGLDGAVVGQRTHEHLRRDLTYADVIGRWRGLVSQASAFRKSVFDTFGPFHEKLTHEGSVMAFRSISLGRIVYVPEPTVLYRLGSGISTYAGGDWRRMKYDEPRKFSLWHLTALRQMLADAERLAEKAALREEIRAELEYWEELAAMNAGEKNVLPAFLRLLRRGRLDARAVRTGLRISVPDSVYRLSARRRRGRLAGPPA